VKCGEHLQQQPQYGLMFVVFDAFLSYKSSTHVIAAGRLCCRILVSERIIFALVYTRKHDIVMIELVYLIME
jgi:hypothetical protein